MSAGERQPLEIAAAVAKSMIRELSPYCELIEVAGSVRRGLPFVGDIEIVAISKPGITIPTLFGDPVHGPPALIARLDTLKAREEIMQGGAWGQKYRSFVSVFETPGGKEPFKIDLFITTMEQWPVIFTIRTGSAEFSKWLVSPGINGYHRGAMPSDCRIKDGRLWINVGDGLDHAVDLTDERDLFRVIGLPWIPLRERDDFRTWVRLARDYHSTSAPDQVK